MFRYTAIVFNAFGITSSQQGEIPEEAVRKACECHKDFRVPIGNINYNPHTGVIFVNGKPCGVVYKHSPFHNHQTFGG
jgi:hypothetical protein